MYVQKNLRFNEGDIKVLEELKEKFRVDSDGDMIKWALRMVHQFGSTPSINALTPEKVVDRSMEGVLATPRFVAPIPPLPVVDNETGKVQGESDKVEGLEEYNVVIDELAEGYINPAYRP